MKKIIITATATAFTCFAAISSSYVSHNIGFISHI